VLSNINAEALMIDRLLRIILQNNLQDMVDKAVKAQVDARIFELEARK